MAETVYTAYWGRGFRPGARRCGRRNDAKADKGQGGQAAEEVEDL